jgi:hypothetical protein
VVFGLNLSVGTLVPGGIALLALLIFQVLTGKRIIHFKGRLHMRVHTWVAYVMALVAVGHGFLGLALAFHWSIP